jgi:hypothetical protein
MDIRDRRVAIRKPPHIHSGNQWRPLMKVRSFDPGKRASANPVGCGAIRRGEVALG